MPEDLPTPDSGIKALEKGKRKRLGKNKIERKNQ